MNPIERRVPDNVGGTETLFDEAPIVGTVEFNDGVIAFGPSLGILFISQNILPPAFSDISLVLASLTALLGIVLLLVKPSYLTLTEWARNHYEFQKREKDLKYNLVTDGGQPIETVEMVPDNDTRQTLGVKQIHPHDDAVERPDGTMVSMVQFTGANMDTADQEQWNSAVQQFSNFANTQLRHDVQLYLPMREFDPTKHLDMYERRQGDADVQKNRFLQEYLKDRIGFTATMAANSFVREYYAVVSVSRREVFESEVDNETGLGSLDALPGSQFIKDFLVGLGLAGQNARAMSKREIQAKQLREIKRRREELSNQMAVGPGNEGEVVDSDRIAVLLKEFWEGNALTEDEQSGLARSRPFVIGEYDREMAEQAPDELGDEQ